MKYLLYFSLLLISCHTNESETSSKQSTINNLAKYNNDSSENEFFSSFIEEFKSKSDFQKSRVRFPLEWITEEFMEPSKTIYLKETDWEYIDFTIDKEAETKESDAYKGVIKESNAGKMYLREGVDNGIMIEYHFQLDTQKWYLVKVIDKSN